MVHQPPAAVPNGAIVHPPLPLPRTASHDSTMYEHRQQSRLMMMLLLMVAVMPIAILLGEGRRLLPFGARITMAAAAAAIVGCALVFSSITVRVASGRLAWFFGPGVLRKEVALDAVAEVTPTTTTFLDGWGVHYTRRGWLYNVAGRDAVLVTMRDGKRFLLGTDEPQVLAQAIREASHV